MPYYWENSNVCDELWDELAQQLTLLSIDFWTVKNITGRLLVGLRWWNFVDAEGKSHWRYESAKDTSRFGILERRIFWGALAAAPIMWIILVCIAFVTLKWEWMIIAIMGSLMNGANLYGYLRCRWGSTHEFTNYISKIAFLSVLSKSNPVQTNQQHSLQSV
uniref:Golgi apparatus membrane protein TVP23 homolog n=1 Tax=Setaria digitata TaxID=48799 RepID=A0A915PQG7_9BILA